MKNMFEPRHFSKFDPITNYFFYNLNDVNYTHHFKIIQNSPYLIIY